MSASKNATTSFSSGDRRRSANPGWLLVIVFQASFLRLSGSPVRRTYFSPACTVGTEIVVSQAISCGVLMSPSSTENSDSDSPSAAFKPISKPGFQARVFGVNPYAGSLKSFWFRKPTIQERAIPPWHSKRTTMRNHHARSSLAALAVALSGCANKELQETSYSYESKGSLRDCPGCRAY